MNVLGPGKLWDEWSLLEQALPREEPFLAALQHWPWSECSLVDVTVGLGCDRS